LICITGRLDYRRDLHAVGPGQLRPASALGTKGSDLLHFVAVATGNRVNRAQVAETEPKDILLRLQFPLAYARAARYRFEDELALSLFTTGGVEFGDHAEQGRLIAALDLDRDSDIAAAKVAADWRRYIYGAVTSLILRSGSRSEQASSQEKTKDQFQRGGQYSNISIYSKSVQPLLLGR
jgi:hypothetical protein